MAFYVYSPNWFSGIDSLLEITVILISIVISYYSLKVYKYFNINKYKYFAFTFVLFALSFISKIISNLIFIVPTKREITSGVFYVFYTTYQKLDYIEDISFFIHKLSLLTSFLILFLIITKENKIETILTFILYVIILSFLINNYFLFNIVIITNSILLFLINYNKDSNNNKNSGLTLFFLIFSISHILFFLAVQHSIFYFLGEVMLISSFIILLFDLIKTFQK